MFGLGEKPVTIQELFEIILKWETADLKYEYPEWTLFDSEFNKQQLLHFLIHMYIVQFENEFEPLRFDTPILHGLLEERKSLPEFGATIQENTDLLEFYPIISTNSHVFQNEYTDISQYHPTLLFPPLFSTDASPIIYGSMNILIVNPNSSQIDSSLRFIEYIATHGDIRTRYMLRKDLLEAVPDPLLVEMETNLFEMLGDAEERYETLSSEDQQLLDEEMAKIQQSLSMIEQSYWLISEESLHMYHKLVPLLTFKSNSTLLYAFDEFSIDFERYSQGQLDTDGFLHTLEKKAEMIFYEEH